MGADLNLLPSPLWGRGWTATGVFTSRGGTGEGVKNPGLTETMPKLKAIHSGILECLRHSANGKGVLN